MHKRHELVLKSVFGISDKVDMRLSKEVDDMVSLAEKRCIKWHGQFREMSCEELVAMTIGIPLNRAVVGKDAGGKDSKGQRNG